MVLRSRAFNHPTWGLVTEVLVQKNAFATEYIFYWPNQKAEIEVLP